MTTLPDEKRRRPARVPVTIRVLLALVVGFIVGGMARGSTSGVVHGLVSAADAVGTIWVNAIRMTVVPLVVSLLIVGVAANAGSRVLGRLGVRAVMVFLVMLLGGGALSAIVSPPVLARVTITDEVAAGLRQTAQGSSRETSAGMQRMPSVAQRIVEWVPPNPVRAAADGAMLPLIVFTLALALAIARLGDAARESVVRVFRGLSEAMLVLVGWVLDAAVVGIFGLAVSLAARTGLAAAGALAWLIGLQAAVCLLYTILLMPIAALLGRVSLRRFAEAAAPAQAVAISARSSLAALPAMIDAAQEKLRLPAAITSFELPFAVSTLRPNVPITWVICVIFLGRLYGVPVEGITVVALVITAVLASFSVPGIPSGSLFIIAPVLVAHGIPAEGVGLLIAVDAIPDMFKTLANVTSHVASAVIVSRVAVPETSPAV